ncbi:Alpha beta hydrolase fold family [Apiospora sp. TS-2023a]
MLGNSLQELLFIRLCIVLLQYGTPILLAGLAAAAATGGWDALRHPASEIAIGYVLLDALYLVFLWIPYNRRLRDEADHPPPLSPEDRRALFLRCDENVPDFDRYLRLWFLGADPTEIRRDNVRDFVLWAFFDRRPGAESEDEAAECTGYLDIIEQRLGHELKPGRGSAQSLRLTFDEIETRYRSFIWYILIGIVDIGTHVQLAWRGFEYHALAAAKFANVLPPRMQSLFARNRSKSGELSYWHRAHTAGPDKKPIVFLHGIGVGLWTYASFLSDLGKNVGGNGQIGIIALEIMPVSFRLTAAPLGKLDFLDEMERVLAAHGWDQFVLITHSYGSALATHMLHSDEFSARVDSVILIDPVTILLHNPDVAYNFTRRRPRGANEWQLWYFASTDPGTAHTLGRHFHWKQNIIWKEELVTKKAPKTNGKLGSNGVSGTNGTAKTNGVMPRGRTSQRNVAVCLAGRDLIVDTLSVAQYLAGNEHWLPTLRDSDQAKADDALDHVEKSAGYGHLEKDGIELLWFDGLDHAQVFDDRKHYDKVKAVIHRYCSK